MAILHVIALNVRDVIESFWQPTLRLSDKLYRWLFINFNRRILICTVKWIKNWDTQSADF